MTAMKQVLWYLACLGIGLLIFNLWYFGFSFFLITFLPLLNSGFFEKFKEVTMLDAMVYGPGILGLNFLLGLGLYRLFKMATRWLYGKGQVFWQKARGTEPKEETL